MTTLRVLVVLVIVLLAGLPVAVWLDVRSVTSRAMLGQADDFSSVIASITDYYATDVVQRVLNAPPGTKTTVTPGFAQHPGAIPLPATFSLQLGRVVSQDQAHVRYRFVSPYPFKGRTPHHFDRFESAALAALTRHPAAAPLTNVSWHGLTVKARYVTPIIMDATCVACHNADPDSPKRNWKPGEVGGIQELTITRPVASSVFSFRFLLLYFLITAGMGLAVIFLQRKQATFLAAISEKLSHYLSPQIYRSIFSGATDTQVRTARKKLTIFFSDILDFTVASERLQPEELTSALNEYFTEMSKIALAYGGTIDKFVGDAILVFFGDPDSRGASEDAAACVRMAVEMQRKVAELAPRWRARGIEHPFRVRMGINTGYCNVGNFGSEDRIDYTIIGAEANLAARLQSAAQPGKIVISYETYALVRESVVARALPAIHVKGVSREVRPYEIEALREEAEGTRLFSEHDRGLELYLDVDALDDVSAARTANLLRSALSALENRSVDSA